MRYMPLSFSRAFPPGPLTDAFPPSPLPGALGRSSYRRVFAPLLFGGSRLANPPGKLRAAHDKEATRISRNSGTRHRRCRCCLPALTGFTTGRRGEADTGHHKTATEASTSTRPRPQKRAKPRFLLAPRKWPQDIFAESKNPERVGFEPTNTREDVTGIPVQRLRPLGHLSNQSLARTSSPIRGIRRPPQGRESYTVTPGEAPASAH